MSITTERKQELVKEYGANDNDTGSPEVQIAILTERIQNLTEHMASGTSRSIRSIGAIRTEQAPAIGP